MTWLIFFHFLFFSEYYLNPLILARSELLSTFFPTWCYQSDELAQGRFPKKDPYFWLRLDTHPVTSNYYLPHLLIGLLMRRLGLDGRWRGFVWWLLGHYLFGSIGWFYVFRSFGCPNLVSVFGAITLTYQAAFIKQQPCLIYTVNWTPWAVLFPWLGIPMMVAGGYLPLAIYLIPLVSIVGFQNNPVGMIIGGLISVILLIPFIKYLPKTIRKVKGNPIEEGFWERRYYFGILPWLLIRSWWSAVAMIPVAVALLFGKHLPRVPWRIGIVSTHILIWFSVMGLASLNLSSRALLAILLIQAVDLWLHNRELPTRPFSELPNRPSWTFNTPLTKFLEGCKDRISGLPYPLFTGHINHIKTLGYSGGMQLKLMAKWRGDRNPNGSGEHDWFRSNEDSEALDRYRVAFAYSRKRPHNWLQTPVRNLWANPRIS